MTKFAKVDGDLVISTMSGSVAPAGGIEIPEAIEYRPIKYLRYDGTNIIDVGGAPRAFFIEDDVVEKHIVRTNTAWQPLTCRVTDELVRDADGTWIVKPTVSAEEVAIKSECARRIRLSVKDGPTQFNMLAAAQAGDANTAEIEAAFAWIAAMQAAARTMVTEGEQDFTNSSKWPAPPAGIDELVEEY